MNVRYRVAVDTSERVRLVAMASVPEQDRVWTRSAIERVRRAAPGAF